MSASSKHPAFYAIAKLRDHRYVIWQGQQVDGLPQMVLTRVGIAKTLKEVKVLWPGAVRWPMLDKLTRDLL